MIETDKGRIVAYTEDEIIWAEDVIKRAETQWVDWADLDMAQRLLKHVENIGRRPE